MRIILVAVLFWLSVGATAQSTDDYYFGELVLDQKTDNTRSGIEATALSFDEQHFYALVPGDSALYVYNRNPETGHLELSEVQRDSLLYSQWIYWRFGTLKSMVLSPDGQNIYISSMYEDSLNNTHERIVIGSRDAVTGRITLQNVYKPQVASYSFLEPDELICFSDDGQYLYAVYPKEGQEDDSEYYDYVIAVMQRDFATGMLTIVQTLEPGKNLSTQMRNVSAITISPDGGYVLVITSSENPLHVFKRNETTGFLTTHKSYYDIELENMLNLSAMVFAEADNQIYFADGDGWLLQCSWDAQTGQVTPIQIIQSAVSWQYPGSAQQKPIDQIVLHPNGRELYALNDLGFYLYTRELDTGYLLYRYQIHAFFDTLDIGYIQKEQFSPTHLVLAGDGRDFYFRENFRSELKVFKRQTVNSPPRAALTVQTHKGFVDTLFQLDATTVSDFHDSTRTLQVRWDWEGDGEWDTEYSTDHDTVHQFDAPGAYSPTLEVRDRDGLFDTASVTVTVFSPEQFSAGQLTATSGEIQGLTELEMFSSLQTIVCSPDGRFLYGITVYANFDNTNFLRIFSRDIETGVLTKTADIRELPGIPAFSLSTLSISPDGRHMALVMASDVAVFSRDSETGQISQPVMMNDVLSVGYGACAAFSPDNNWLYVVNSFNQLVGFQRTGANWDTEEATVLLSNAGQFVLRADGTRLFAGGHVYERDTRTGEITELFGNDTYGMPWSLCISPDGRFMYGLHVKAFSQLWGARIDEEAGTITEIERILKHNTPMYNSLNEFLRPGAMTMSPDGRNIYVTQSDRTYGIITFFRDSVNGYLMATGALLEEENIDSPMKGANSLVVAPDGGHVYVASTDLFNLSVFRRTIITNISEQTMSLFGPKEYRLQQNYPNPFNPVTTIRYELPQNAHVRLTIYDVLGREVVRLVDEGYLAGAYSVVWNGTNRYGVPVASGIYIYRLEAGRNFVQSRKMLLLK
jgi:6-phosphogluconolactonase (cycloisomerase 2 family)